MSDPRLDARVRNALQLLPTPDDQDTNQALDDVLGRSRRRPAASWVPVVAAAVVTGILLLLVPLLVDSDRGEQPTPPAVSPTAGRAVLGTWSHDLRGAKDGSWNGSWTMTLQSNGVLALDPPAGSTNVTDGAAFAVSGGQVRIDAFVNGVCADMAPGVYRWSRTGDRLTLVALTEPCPIRQDLFTGTWTNVG